MAAPTFASLYRISVRRADGGISFRPKTHDVSRDSAAKMRDRMEIFANTMRGRKIATECGKKGKGGGPTPFRQFRGCLRSTGKRAFAAGALAVR